MESFGTAPPNAPVLKVSHGIMYLSTSGETDVVDPERHSDQRLPRVGQAGYRQFDLSRIGNVQEWSAMGQSRR